MTDENAQNEQESADHVDEVPDGVGCTEIWEYLSAERGEEGE